MWSYHDNKILGCLPLTSGSSRHWSGSITSITPHLDHELPRRTGRIGVGGSTRGTKEEVTLGWVRDLPLGLPVPTVSLSLRLSRTRTSNTEEGIQEPKGTNPEEKRPVALSRWLTWIVPKPKRTETKGTCQKTGGQGTDPPSGNRLYNFAVVPHEDQSRDYIFLKPSTVWVGVWYFIQLVWLSVVTKN